MHAERVLMDFFIIPSTTSAAGAAHILRVTRYVRLIHQSLRVSFVQCYGKPPSNISAPLYGTCSRPRALIRVIFSTIGLGLNEHTSGSKHLGVEFLLPLLELIIPLLHFLHSLSHVVHKHAKKGHTAHQDIWKASLCFVLNGSKFR